MVVVLLTGDLTVLSRVEGAAMRAGADVRAAADASHAVERCAAEPAALLIVDLSTPSLDVESLIEQLRSAATSLPRVVAFGPHVHGERLEEARRAGCDDVVSRGEFFARIELILNR